MQVDVFIWKKSRGLLSDVLSCLGIGKYWEKCSFKFFYIKMV